MFTRKLGALLRGKATPFQIITAATLGAMLGFAPAVRQAPGLYALLIAALLIINANIGFALLVAGVTRLLSYLAAPIAFEVGRFLLDGPATGVARTIVNAPVFAWCGLSYYAVTGGQVLGFVAGLTLGFVVAAGVRGFQRKLRAAEGNPSKLTAIAEKGWGKALVWVFFGGRAKGSWDEILAKRVGNPIRIVGVLAVLVLGGALWFAQRYITRTWAAEGLSSRLALVNGATADVGQVTLDFRAGEFGVQQLALADPESLERDLFRADALAADFDQVDILRRRVHMAKLVVSGAASGAARSTPGVRITPPAEAEPTEPPAEGWWSLDQVLAEADVWKGRLQQVKRVLESISGEPTGSQREESARDRARRQAREGGWFEVEADHLIDEAPTFQLSELTIEGLAADWLPDMPLDVRGFNLSTQPKLLDKAPRLTATSRDGALGVDLDLAPASRAGGAGRLALQWKGLAVDSVLGRLKLDRAAPMSGGTLDLAIDGAWAAGAIGELDLPLQVTFHGTTFRVPGAQPTTVERFTLPIGLAGPIDALRIKFDSDALTRALRDAGKAELAGRLQSELTERLDGVLQGPAGDKLKELGEKTGIELPADVGKGVQEGAKGVLKGILGGKKDPK